MSELYLLIFLVTHWFADFILQTNDQAKMKSSNFPKLLEHTANYSFIWLIVLYVLTKDLALSCAFMAITFIVHTITDFITSRINAKLYLAEKRHAFFIMIGFDQILHYIQLYLTYKLLF